ncbi:MAG: hypothetical protein ACJ749_20335, partial [Flavisolibacter sp.]
MICFIYGSAFSQEKTTSITVSPAIISFRTVALQPGVEYHFSKRWSISGEFCYAKPPERRTYFDKTVLLRSAVELK